MAEADRQPPTIPGYTLTTRLGAGGYGEVWLAHAPGGLTKAVKIIYGAFDDRRAELELRSLHRIKSVRHPFLLSLERIEVVDNRLAIVTELADSSLKDRYDECRRAGMPGIPREELLGFMRDAADALDFLSDRHSLQHLDVKPENLLIVGGHIKVADFGLVKEVGRTQASLVGGLTPLYSSPEVFQGTPGARSDQYSLAVVYQEMLTGAPPFAGTNAAELTMQHLQGEPNLAPLPMHDRFVIARALSKNPAQRFTSCLEMVDALRAADVGTVTASTPAAEASRSFDDCVSAFPDRRASPRPGPVAEFLNDRQPADDGRGTAVLWTSAVNNDPPVRQSIAPVEAKEFRSPPTAVIGVGGIAGRVMRQLRSRLAREVGDAHHDLLAMLLLDSDPRGIAAAVQGNDREALRSDETIALPLRRPQDYREDSALLMRWLSRRWLYNIPKSLRTEGLRPLGRLAFVDHSRQIGERIRFTLERAVRDHAEAGEAGPSSQNNSTRPLRIYVIAGTAGDTGSGMSLDVGYAVRAMADKLGLGAIEVVGLFLHATPRDAQQKDLARVNSFAWLREFNHYQRTDGSYPGDEGCGLPAFPTGTKAFDAAYFIDLGIVGDDGDLDEAVNEVAEYVYLDAATPVRQFFTACRESEVAGDFAPLRSFALSTAAVADDRAIRAAAISISRAVLMEYLGCGVQQHIASSPMEPIELAMLAGRTHELIAQLLASRVEEDAAIPQQLGAYIRRVDADFAAPDERPGAFVAGRTIEETTSSIAGELAQGIATAVLQQVNARGKRLAGAMSTLETQRQQLQQLEAESTKLAAGIAQQAMAALAQFDRWQRERSTNEAAVAREREFGGAYRNLRIDQHAMLGVAAIARRLLAELRTIGDQLGEVGRQIKGFVQQFPQAAALQGDDSFALAVATQLVELSSDVDDQLEKEFTAPLGGLLVTAMGSPRDREQFCINLLRLATRRAERLATSPELTAAVMLPTAGESGQSVDGLELPAVTCLGGKYAVLETKPGTAAGFAAWEATPIGTMLTGVGSQAVRCCEAWNLSLSRIALDLIDNRRDCIEFAERVACRCDVDWKPLGRVIAPSAAATAFPVEASPTAVTQVL